MAHRGTEGRGKQGVRVNGMNPSGGADTDYTGIFTVENGGKFIADCTDYNVMAFTSGNELTEDTVKRVIVLPDNYLPDDYAIRMVSGENGEMQYAATIAKTDAELTLESESVSGAGGALTLPKKSSGGGSHSVAVRTPVAAVPPPPLIPLRHLPVKTVPLRRTVKQALPKTPIRPSPSPRTAATPWRTCWWTARAWRGDDLHLYQGDCGAHHLRYVQSCSPDWLHRRGHG